MSTLCVRPRLAESLLAGGHRNTFFFKVIALNKKIYAGLFKETKTHILTVKLVLLSYKTDQSSFYVCQYLSVSNQQLDNLDPLIIHLLVHNSYIFQGVKWEMHTNIFYIKVYKFSNMCTFTCNIFQRIRIGDIYIYKYISFNEILHKSIVTIHEKVGQNWLGTTDILKSGK